MQQWAKQRKKEYEKGEKNKNNMKNVVKNKTVTTVKGWDEWR